MKDYTRLAVSFINFKVATPIWKILIYSNAIAKTRHYKLLREEHINQSSLKPMAFSLLPSLSTLIRLLTFI